MIKDLDKLFDTIKTDINYEEYRASNIELTINISMNNTVTWENMLDSKIFNIDVYRKEPRILVTSTQFALHDTNKMLYDIGAYIFNKKYTNLLKKFPEISINEEDLYIAILDFYFHTIGKCPTEILVNHPSTFINILFDLGFLSKYTTAELLSMYEITNNTVFLTQEIQDIFLF